MAPTEEDVTVSTVSTTATTGCHMLKIDGYTRIANMHGWTCPGFVSVSLTLHHITQAQAEVRFSLVPQHHYGLTLPLGEPHEKRFTRVFYSGVTEGFDRFVVRKELEKSWYLKDDGFAIRCDIAVVNKLVVKEPVVRPADLERLGMVCNCNDDMCTLHHTLSFAQVAKLKFLEFFLGCFPL
ncbi:hypothetical protein DAI22_11g126625 [Oryza sativa Japonica Group]|nr:hypothetical protein DAI22_11g126625 [Oryza sativa Japonica Group]